MSQRVSGYDRRERDGYQTPAWVTAAIAAHLAQLGARHIWEPAAGDGQIVDELRRHGFDAIGLLNLRRASTLSAAAITAWREGMGARSGSGRPHLSIRP